MRLIIEARIDGAADTSMPVLLGVIERSENDLTPGTLGLSLQEGREFLRRIQGVAVFCPDGFLARQPFQVSNLQYWAFSQGQWHHGRRFVWLKHREHGRLQGRQLYVVAGRATLAEGGTSLYGYVTRQVPSGAKRLDLFLAQQGVRPGERVTAITDGAFEFDTAAAGSALTGARILDWFHIAMKFRAAQMSAVMLSLRSPAQWREIERSLDRAKWLVWHGKARTALVRLQSILDAVDVMPKQDASTLILNVGKLLGYLQLNERYLVPYAARYRAGLPISSATAESAVNELVSTRMAKRQQMRWSEQGAHLLVQVRAAVLNGTLRPREKPVPWSGNAGHERCYAHREWELEAA